MQKGLVVECNIRDPGETPGGRSLSPEKFVYHVYDVRDSDVPKSAMNSEMTKEAMEAIKGLRGTGHLEEGVEGVMAYKDPVAHVRDWLYKQHGDDTVDLCAGSEKSRPTSKSHEDLGGRVAFTDFTRVQDVARPFGPGTFVVMNQVNTTKDASTTDDAKIEQPSSKKGKKEGGSKGTAKEVVQKESSRSLRSLPSSTSWVYCLSDVRRVPTGPAKGRIEVGSLSRHLLLAASEGKLGDACKLVSEGADVNFTAPGRWTPLHRAAARGHSDVLAVLLHQGAQPNARTAYGVTPLHAAARGDLRGRCVDLLVAFGGDVEAKDRNGCTPLNYASKAKNTNAFDRLMAVNRAKERIAAADGELDAKSSSLVKSTSLGGKSSRKIKSTSLGAQSSASATKASTTTGASTAAALKDAKEKIQRKKSTSITKSLHPKDDFLKKRQSKDDFLKKRQSKDDFLKKRQSKDDFLKKRQSKDDFLKKRQSKDDFLKKRQSKDDFLKKRQSKDDFLKKRQSKDTPIKSGSIRATTVPSTTVCPVKKLTSRPRVDSVEAKARALEKEAKALERKVTSSSRMVIKKSVNKTRKKKKTKRGPSKAAKK